MAPRISEIKSDGVPDFDKKIGLCCNLLGATTYREVVFEVFSRTQDRSLAQIVANRFHKMRDHYPTNKESHLFWEGLASRLGCNGDTVTGAMLIDANIDQFIEYLPAHLQEQARGKVRSESRYVPYPSIDLAGPRPIETITVGFTRGRIDQKHYYLGADSANAWFALVRAEAYPSYDDCKTGLQTLLASDQWKAALSSSRPGSVVMLAGGGAPTKDLLFLRNILAQPHVGAWLNYYLVDISLYMLRESRLFLEEHGRTIDGIEKVTIIPLECDVLNMTGRQREDFHKHGGALFTLTAGTIGNISEHTFFNSLNNASRIGDLFVLAADTIDGVPSNEVASVLTAKYSHSAFRQWIRPVVRAVLSESGTHERLEGALNRVEVALRPGAEANSDIPGSWSVVLTLEIDHKPVTLLCSTRYETGQLTKFVSSFGWELLHHVSSPNNRHFKQFLFRRTQVESSGIPSIP